MMRRWILPILTGLLLFACVAGLALEAQRAERAERMLEEIYQSALLETAEQTQALSLALEKLLVTGDAAQGTRMLQRVSRLAEDVRRNLTLLPLSHEAMAPTLIFANQLAEYAAVLLPELVQQRRLSAEDRSQLEELLTGCTQLGSRLALARHAMERGGLTLLSAEGAFSAEPSVVRRPLEALGDADHGMQYPTLVYDGAFSDARQTGHPRGLPEETVTQAQALEIARAFVGEDRVLAVRAAPAVTGAMAAWGVTVETKDVRLNLEITQQGGKPLWMMPETAGFAATISPEACQARAADFLRQHGFDAMEATFRQQYGDGLLLVCFAAVQGDWLLYPDLVKVQVRMDTGEVVGLEAHGYWQNHEPRALPAPGLTAEQAQAHLPEGVALTSSPRLCVIPQGGTERLCYECRIRRGEGEYLLYLDADTGQEAELLKLISTAEGVLTADCAPICEKFHRPG